MSGFLYFLLIFTIWNSNSGSLLQAVDSWKQELCFNGALMFNFSVLENSEAVLAASFGNVTEGWAKPEYSITINDGTLWIGKGSDNFSSGVWVKANLDREEKDLYLFNITCEMKTEEGLVVKTSVPGTLNVKDQNDNPPSTQEGFQRANVSISLHHEHNFYKPHQRLIQEYPQSLLVRDLDTIGVNEFELVVHDDRKGLFNITYTTQRIPGGIHNRTEYTTIMPMISFSAAVKEIQAWKGLYCVNVSFIDIGYIGNPDKSSMDYKICIHWVNETLNETRGSSDNEDNAISPAEEMTNGNESASANTIQPFSSIVSPVKTGFGGCDDVCVVFLSTGITIVFFLLLGFIYAFKCRVSQKNKGRRMRNLLSSDGHSGDLAGANHISEMDYIGPGSRNPLDGFGTNALSNNDMDIAARSSLLNPRITMSNWQIDSKWEIPRAALTLEEVLGVGEFGRVFKGRTHVIPGHEGTFVPVAVKMLKDNREQTGKSCREEFEAEFSLLKQVDHPNVIKLLGACTTPGGPLYLVMEYAEFGSLRSFLRKCRRVESLHNSNLEADFSGNTLPSTPKDAEQKDYVVSPQELLQFSWQIAKGMTYLSDMKMVHRDLAARNILLTMTKVCKISDFGLTRDIYVDEAYKKKSRDRVPVKWLAPESLADEVYTAKSDVWSFGILLWELATLGASPYPGIASEELYTLLKNGYRMAQPQNCSMELYALMRQCWANEPQNRPSFCTLGITLSKLLEDGIEYLKLDLPLVSNPGYEYFS